MPGNASNHIFRYLCVAIERNSRPYSCTNAEDSKRAVIYVDQMLDQMLDSKCTVVKKMSPVPTKEWTLVNDKTKQLQYSQEG